MFTPYLDFAFKSAVALLISFNMSTAGAMQESGPDFSGGPSPKRAPVSIALLAKTMPQDLLNRQFRSLSLEQKAAHLKAISRSPNGFGIFSPVVRAIMKSFQKKGTLTLHLTVTPQGIICLGENHDITDFLNQKDLPQLMEKLGYKEFHAHVHLDKKVSRTGLETAFKILNIIRLTRLTLTGVLRYTEMKVIAESLSRKGLTYLNLEKNNLRSLEIMGIANSVNLENITYLNLRSNVLGDDGVRVIAANPKMRNLRRLNLRKNDFGPIGATAIAKSPYLGNLTHLILRDNSIGDIGVIAIFEGSKMGNLRYLDLTRTWVNDPGAKAAAGSKKMSSLKHLNLSLNPFGDDGLNALAHSTYLANVEVQLQLSLFKAKD